MAAAGINGLSEGPVVHGRVSMNRSELAASGAVHVPAWSLLLEFLLSTEYVKWMGGSHRWDGVASLVPPGRLSGDDTGEDVPGH
jgi:hypothetical protein